MDEPAGPIALVLAGGGARGAYEIGALSVLLPELERRGERVEIVVGTSVGAINAAWLAANAHRTAEEAARDGLRLWSDISWTDVAKPLLAPTGVGRVIGYLGEMAGVPRSRLYSLLDPSPLEATLDRLIAFPAIRRNVRRGLLSSAAVVATSGLTSRSVVFHEGGGDIAPDDIRGIDYVPSRIGNAQVRASAAIPVAFPAVEVESPRSARGWYFDGGTRLDTPIKPALSLGAARIVVVALNSTSGGPRRLADGEQPDVFDGAAQAAQAFLADPLANDIRTLADINDLLLQGRVPPGRTDRRLVPYILVAPQSRDAIGSIAREIYDARYAGVTGAKRSPDLALLGRLLAVPVSDLHGELYSYFFFAGDFAQALIDLGRSDAQAWVDAEHSNGLWQVGALPSATSP